MKNKSTVLTVIFVCRKLSPTPIIYLIKTTILRKDVLSFCTYSGCILLFHKLFEVRLKSFNLSFFLCFWHATMNQDCWGACRRGRLFRVGLLFFVTGMVSVIVKMAKGTKWPRRMSDLSVSSDVFYFWVFFFLSRLYLLRLLFCLVYYYLLIFQDWKEDLP